MDAEKNKWVYRPSQADANYTPLSPNPDQLCDGCRWFVAHSDGGPMCHLIDNYPSDIVATGRCDRWEARPEPEINPLPVVIVDNVEMDELERALENPAVQKPLLQAILDAKQSPEPPVESAKSHDHAEPVDIYIAPASNKRGLFSKALDLFRRDTLKPGVSILKSADQPRMMFIVTSSSYQDRHTQWIETRTLEKDVARMWTKDDDVFMGGVQHLFWHWKELGPVGEIVYSDVWGPFQVDVSREILGDPVSFAFYNYVENHPEIEWGASQNFIAYKSEDRPNGTFTHIRRRETTTLPREDAAHLLTFTGVVPMPTKRQEYLNKMMKEAYGIDNASELLEKGLDALKAELEAKGVVHKAAVPAGAEATTEAAADLFAPMMLKMVEDVADVLERVDKLETGTTGLAEKQKAFEEGAVAALQKSVDELTNTVKGISDELKLAPRSVQQQQGGSSNLPDDETITFEQLKQKAPGGNGKRDDFFGDMDVPAQS